MGNRLEKSFRFPLGFLQVPRLFIPSLGQLPIEEEGRVGGRVGVPVGFQSGRRDQLFDVMRPGVLRESAVFVNQFRMRGDAYKNARLEAALDGISDQIVSGRPPARDRC